MQKARIVFGYGLLVFFLIKSCMYSHVIPICIRVAAAAEEIVYEVVAEPQEPQGQAPPQEVREESAQGPTYPSVEQQTQGKPRCTSYSFKLCHLYMSLIIVH
jgi:hypothetical protein